MTDTIDTGLPQSPTAFGQAFPAPNPSAMLAPPAVNAVAQPAATVAPPALITGPAAIFSDDPSLTPLGNALPALPNIVPTAPSSPRMTGVPLTLDDLFSDDAGSQKRSGLGTRLKAVVRTAVRWILRLAILAALVGGGYAAYLYGPDLYDEYVSGDAQQGPDETQAPLAFPIPTPDLAAPAAPIRTAEFVLEGLPGSPGMTYHVTTDFETNVSQVDITRDEGPDLQILTYGDAAFIRRIESNQWYLLERGQFPLDDRLERSDWVRQLEELIPTAVRSTVSIDAAGDTTVSGVPTRHLSLTLDITTLGGASTTDDAAAVPSPDGSVVEPRPSVTGNIEVWVDKDGLVRKVSGAPQLGAETITVVRTDTAAWVPEYPDASLVEPLTAATLVDLGI